MSTILQQYYGIDEQRPTVALAPMAGVTDLPFRTLCESLGADYSVTEMAATAPQLLASDKNATRLHFTANNNSNILQIIGNDAQHMADAVSYYTSHSDTPIHLIDINLGCPAKKVSRKGAGSALLSDLSLVQRILAAVVTVSPVPVTLKTRLGTDHDNYTLIPLAEIACKVGIQQITVHGRTRACRFNGVAQFHEIAKLKHHFPDLTVIANGDINSVELAHQVLAETQCDGLMIGRAAVGNPWLFYAMRQSFDSRFTHHAASDIELMLTHIQQTHQFYGEDKGVRFARKHIQAYLSQFGKAEYFCEIATVNDAELQLQRLSQLIH